MAWPPALTLDAWRRLWLGTSPGMGLFVIATDISFPGPISSLSNNTLGVVAQFGFEPTGFSVEEGLYELSWSMAHFGGAGVDQIQRWNLFIDDQNQKVLWNRQVVIASGSSVTVTVRKALRAGYRIRMNNLI